jgi:hypothetical protein
LDLNFIFGHHSFQAIPSRISIFIIFTNSFICQSAGARSQLTGMPLPSQISQTPDTHPEKTEVPAYQLTSPSEKVKRSKKSLISQPNTLTAPFPAAAELKEAIPRPEA